MKTFIVIPTYNERENLSSLLEQIHQLDPDLHLLIVDDGSPDGTGALADFLRERNPEKIFVLHRKEKKGLGPAYIAGFKLALELGADKIVQMDADHSHPIDQVPKMIKLATDYDLVIGSRWVDGGGTPGWSLLRRIISRGGSFYARTLLRMSVRDMTSGFKCFDAKVLKSFDLDTFHMSGYGFQIELIYRTFKSSFSMIEMPIRFVDRSVGVSKMSSSIFFEAVLNVLKLRRMVHV